MNGPPDMESPPAMDRGASIAVGAIAGAPYTATCPNRNSVEAAFLLVEQAIQVLIHAVDLAAGDPDREEDNPAEQDGTEQDASWQEWHTLSGSQKRSANLTAGHEDDELDDAPEDDDPAGQCDEDGINTALGKTFAQSAGCSISDPDYEHDGREPEEGR